MKLRYRLLLCLTVGLLAFFSARHPHGQTVGTRLVQFGDAARGRLQPCFDQAGVHYPPRNVQLVAIKAERVMQLYASDGQATNRWIRSYPILAASGHLGPKLAEGDGQVPEGIYRIESLNPNSQYHVSLRIGYPNAFDRAMAAKMGRTDLGGDIMIHGQSVSIGCLAMGNVAAEDLFVLAADTGVKNLAIIITPVDFRMGKTVPSSQTIPDWGHDLYAQIKSALSLLPPQEAK